MPVTLLLWDGWIQGDVIVPRNFIPDSEHNIEAPLLHDEVSLLLSRSKFRLRDAREEKEILKILGANFHYANFIGPLEVED